MAAGQNGFTTTFGCPFMIQTASDMLTFAGIYPTPFGSIRLVFDLEDRLHALRLLQTKPVPTPFPVPDIWQQKLDLYFAGHLQDFAIDTLPSGTAYQQKIWAAVTSVPFGRTATYQDIARLTGSHPRAVGMACSKNPLSLLIPTHRIVPQGYQIGRARSEATQYLRDWLLQHERQISFKAE